METIVLEIDDKSAKAWNNSSPLARASYESKIVALVKEFQETEQVDEDGFTKPQRDFLAKETSESTEHYVWWNDEELIVELDKEVADLESGKLKGFTLQESMARLKDKSRRSE